MPVNKIWVLAEAFEGKPLTVSLELITAARGLGSTVEAVTWGEVDNAPIGAHGATKVYSVGDIGQQLPGPVVAAAIAEQLGSGDAPDAILIPQTYDGRDVAGRLSAKVDRPVLTNVVGIEEAGGSLQTVHAIFGGNEIVKAQSKADPPAIIVVKAKSFAAEEAGGGAPEVVTISAPDVGATGAAKVENRHVEEH